MCVKAANKRLQADIGILLATWKITFFARCVKTTHWIGRIFEMNHNMERLTPPPPALSVMGSLSPSAFPSDNQLCGAACVGLPLTSPRPADAVGHQRIQLSR